MVLFFKKVGFYCRKKALLDNITFTNLVNMAKDALVGKTVIVISPISLHNPGSIKVEGIEWTAITEEEKFEPGDLVEIVSVTGNTLLVKKA